MKFELDVTSLSDKNVALEERAIELASKIFHLVTSTDTMGIGVRGFELAFQALARVQDFVEGFEASNEISELGLKKGYLKINLEEKKDEKNETL